MNLNAKRHQWETVNIDSGNGLVPSDESLSEHSTDVIMTTMASQITSLTVVYSTVYSDADQRTYQSSASLTFVWGIHQDRWIPLTKGQLRGKCFHLMTSSCQCWPISLMPLCIMQPRQVRLKSYKIFFSRTNFSIRIFLKFCTICRSQILECIQYFQR